jgi:hypothetical protein
MNLMQGYALESGKVGVEDVGSWRDSDILDFVSAVTSAEGASQLREVSRSRNGCCLCIDRSSTSSSRRYGAASRGGRKRCSAI